MKLKFILPGSLALLLGAGPGHAIVPPPEGAHPTICEHLGCKPGDLKIEITAWSDFASFVPRKDYGKKEVELIRKVFAEYAVITEAERKWMFGHLSMAVSGPRKGVVRFSKTSSAKWSYENFLILTFANKGEQSDKDQTVLLAPKEWLKILNDEKH